MKMPIAFQCQLFQDLFLTEPTILHSQPTLSLPCFCPTCHFHLLEFCWCKSSFKLRNIDTTTFLSSNSWEFLLPYEFSSLPSSAQHVSNLVCIGLFILLLSVTHFCGQPQWIAISGYSRAGHLLRLLIWRVSLAHPSWTCFMTCNVCLLLVQGLCYIMGQLITF